jgi:hypothetical protein
MISDRNAVLRAGVPKGHVGCDRDCAAMGVMPNMAHLDVDRCIPCQGVQGVEGLLPMTAGISSAPATQPVPIIDKRTRM